MHTRETEESDQSYPAPPVQGSSRGNGNQGSNFDNADGIDVQVNSSEDEYEEEDKRDGKANSVSS